VLILEDERRLCKEHDTLAIFFYGSAFLFLCGYWAECFLTKSVKKLSHMSKELHDKATAEEYYNTVAETEPLFQWKIECFHYERRRVPRKDLGGYEDRTAKLVTHEATKYVSLFSFCGGRWRTAFEMFYLLLQVIL
jgi:hypothetical protein